MPAYNRYIARLHRLLQGGRHVADIGVLYPIGTLQASYWFHDHDHYRSEPAPAEADYMDLGEMLSLELRRDFTFIHPEVLEEKCVVENDTLLLRNKVNWERYRVFILPGSKAISLGTLRKIKEFYDQGGQVIATTCLPDSSVELGLNDEVKKLIAELFGAGDKPNQKGGRAIFIAKPTAAALKSALDQMLLVPDVDLETALQPMGGNLSYIHKVFENQEVYFFANSSDSAVSINLQLRGRLKPELWGPNDRQKSCSRSCA